MVLDASTILAIPISAPERLFTKDNIKEEFRKFALQWHPDRNKDPKATDVFAHIQQLHSTAIDFLSKGIWHIPGLYEFSDVNGKAYRIRYKVAIPYELGTMYVGDTIIAYTVNKSFKSLYMNAVHNIRNFKYSSDNMKNEFSKYLPVIKCEVETKDYYILCLEKTKDVLPLSVVLKYYDGFIDPKHVAWIMSSLHNMLCYLSYTNIVHNDINTNTYFVSPEMHSGLLLGGWWYSANVGGTLKTVPAKTYSYMSNKAKADKKAEILVDNEMARAVCRLLLGDEQGFKLLSNKDIPVPFVNWLRLPGSGKPIKDYETWSKQVVIDSFGKRRFVEMDIDINSAYGKFSI